MGFIVHETPIVVRLRNTEYDGAEARCSPCTVAEYLAVQQDRSDKSYIQFFVDHLIGWNLENVDGEPIPATGDGVAQLPPSLPLSLSLGYASAASRVVRDRPFAPPEETASTNGQADPDEVMTTL